MIKRCFQPLSMPLFASGALLFLRVIVGIAFMIYGSGKIQTPFSWMPEGGPLPIPPVFQLLAALAEFCGGLALILGALTPIATFGIGFTMLVATYFHAIVMNDPFVNKSGGGDYGTALVFLSVMVALHVIGPGKFSLDKLLFNERS